MAAGGLMGGSILPPSNAGPPARLQLSRTPGFDLQLASRRLNGLGAVGVARPSRWGNPFRVACSLPEISTETAVRLFRDGLERTLSRWPSVRDDLAQLRGKNLACWCKPGAPCHADVLLDLANRPVCEAVPEPAHG